MKILVTGDRDWTDRECIQYCLAVAAELAAPEQITLIHGKARGADTIAGEIGAGLDFNVVAVPADWEQYGRAAGPIRNREMLAMEPDLVIAFHDDLENSKGTRNCVEQAEKLGIPVSRITTKLPGKESAKVS